MWYSKGIISRRRGIVMRRVGKEGIGRRIE
jgi:hypothetical protein